MKKTIIATLVTLAGFSAYADGFKCVSDSGLNIKVYNHTDPSQGTRTAAIMVVSDSTVGAGNKTIATFPQTKGVLNSSGSFYTADVDLRMSGSNRSGELIGGTKLGQLDSIELAVDFSYFSPVAAGTELSGRLTLVKRDGQVLHETVSCERYLKN